MKYQSKLKAGGVLGILFILYIVLLKTVDVAPAGDSKAEVGLSSVNQAFFDLVHDLPLVYKLTEVIGYLAIAVALVFAAIGGIQLITRRSLKKVDAEIYALGGLYVVLGGLYVLFEKFIVNCRPVIMEGETEAEASFPSSHTMLSCVIMGSTILVLRHFIKNDGLRKLLTAVCACVMAFMVIGRLICGVHWLTDIIGGVFISAVLLMLFAGVLGLLESKQKTA